MEFFDHAIEELISLSVCGLPIRSQQKNLNENMIGKF